jgi:hypothetical protein
MKRLCLLATIAACGFPTPSEQFACETATDCEGNRECIGGYCVLPQPDGGGNGGPDGPPNGTPDADYAMLCMGWTAVHFDPCAIVHPSSALDLSTAGIYTYDTGTATLTDPGGGTSTPSNEMIASGRLISIEGLTIGAGVTLRVVGPSPLVLASWSTITVADNAIVDASSSVLGGDGAGTQSTACAVAGTGENNGDGGGGGGGGGFRGAGGGGGDGDGGGGNGGGPGNNIAPPTVVMGGCRGGNGGQGQLAGGAGGRGGGAVQLTAKLSVTIAGTLHAGGAGGASGPQTGDAGGGGGGSGGWIGIDSAIATIAGTAIVAANGGGGGGGSDADGSAVGSGSDATASILRAPGGISADAGDGGAGSGGLGLTGLNGTDNDVGGGGGGGGGAGFVFIESANSTIDPLAVLSPLAIPSP